MRLEEVMVLWNTREGHSGHAGTPQIAIVRHADDNRHLNYLGKSMGAAWGAWKTAQPEGQAAHFLAIFTQAVGRDGVPADEAQREFLKIDEYREWLHEGTGPFADAYWGWASAAA